MKATTLLIGNLRFGLSGSWEGLMGGFVVVVLLLLLL